jgi:ABC-type spermidine/putrescine transport system permease subunit II
LVGENYELKFLAFFTYQYLTTMTVPAKLFAQYKAQWNWKIDLLSVCEVARAVFLYVLLEACSVASC